jgi:hypothetical protein
MITIAIYHLLINNGPVVECLFIIVLYYFYSTLENISNVFMGIE